jgi:hypothetical protein
MSFSLTPCVLRMSLFYQRSFLAPFILGVPLFSSGVFLEPMSEGSDSTHLLMASLVGTKELVECKANLVSYFDTGFTYFWGTKLLLLLRGT